MNYSLLFLKSQSSSVFYLKNESCVKVRVPRDEQTRWSPSSWFPTEARPASWGCWPCERWWPGCGSRGPWPKRCGWHCTKKKKKRLTYFFLSHQARVRFNGSWSPATPLKIMDCRRKPFQCKTNLIFCKSQFYDPINSQLFKTFSDFLWSLVGSFYRLQTNRRLATLGLFYYNNILLKICRISA